MSLAVAAAALDRALKGTASTVQPPQLLPPQLHLHRKSFSTFRDNTSAYARSVSPGRLRMRSHCEGPRPQSKYKNVKGESGYRINSHQRDAGRNYSSVPFFETSEPPVFRKNTSVPPDKSSNVSFGDLSRNGARHRSFRDETPEYKDKFYSIPRFPFRSTSFNEKFSHPHEDFRARSFSSNSPTYRNQYGEQWKNDRFCSRRGMYSANEMYEVERKSGPPRTFKRSLITSTCKNKHYSAEREKAKEISHKLNREPTCSPQVCTTHTGNSVIHISKDAKTTNSRKSSSNQEEKDADNLGIASSKNVRPNLVPRGLQPNPDKSELPKDDLVKKSDEVRANSPVRTDGNSNFHGGNVVVDERDIGSSASAVKGSKRVSEGYPCSKKEALSCNRSLNATNERKNEKPEVADGSPSLDCSSKCRVGDLDRGNGQPLHGLEEANPASSEELKFAESCSKPTDSKDSSEILEFRSICEERNGSIVVKPDIASEILKECFSSSDGNEECIKSVWLKSHNASRSKAEGDQPSVTLQSKDELDNLNEADSMFDFIYHSESEGFKSSSPKKIADCLANRSSLLECESENIVPEKRSRRRTQSILSSIKSSRKKLLEASGASEVNGSPVAELQTHSGVDSEESSRLESRQEVEIVEARCAKKFVGSLCNSKVKENHRAVKDIEKTRPNASEPCIVSVSVNEMRPLMTTRWHSIESETASNSREGFRSYHSCEKFHSQESKYKTELCRAFQIRGSCRYGSRCNYAHGLDQLKVSFHHGKYKTRNCQAYHESGYCRYGARCSFIHDLEEGILKCSIANKEILEALHHWPEEESAVDRSATVTWRVFTGCSSNNHNDTMLEFAAIPSLKPADIQAHQHPNSPESFDMVTSPGPGLYDTPEDVARSRDCSAFEFPESETLFPSARTKPVDSPKMVDEHRSESIQKSIFVSDFSYEQNECPGTRSSLENVNDILNLLRSVETESFAIHRSHSPSNRALHQPREMRIVSRFPCSRQSDHFNRHDIYNCRARAARQGSGNFINLLGEASLNDFNDSRVEVMKMKKCFSFHQKGFCLYGPNCLFIHDE